MIDQLLAEGKLVEVENESRFARATYRYRGFIVSDWASGLNCIRPCEVGHIPDEMVAFLRPRRFGRTHHFLSDGTETACLCAAGSLEEIFVHIDSWWASMQGPSLRRGEKP